MTAVYQHRGIRFQYPQGWQLDDSDADCQNWSVSVHSPLGGFWSITVHEAPADDADQLNQRMLEVLAAEYSQFESEPANQQIAGLETTGYDMDFYCLDFLVTAQLRAVQRGRLIYQILCQAENRDFDELAPVFSAISHSLLATEESSQSRT